MNNIKHSIYFLLLSHTCVLDCSVFPFISSSTSILWELLNYGWQGWLWWSSETRSNGEKISEQEEIHSSQL